jgi:sec-independent protein translocase protein TatB
MPSFQDSAVIFFLALLLFGPKKLPELARQLGKLMAEFRRASNEFRMQMEDELRIADQEEQRKKIAAMEAAAPVAPAIPAGTESTVSAENTVGTENTVASEAVPSESDVTPERIAQLTHELVEDHAHIQPTSEPLPIATSGDLNLMPPSTGLPISNSALSPVLDSIPHVPDSEPATTEIATSEATHHG